MKPFRRLVTTEESPSALAAAPRRSIGAFIRDARELSDENIERILAFQRQHGGRFGEAAVALRLANQDDVLEALAQQFQYTTGAGRDREGELVTAADPFGDQADAFRELRTRLLLEVLQEGRCAISIVSPEVGDGKTYLSANLAVAFSQLGARTLLIDADLRSPRQHRLLGVGHRVGLSDVLAGFAELGSTLRPVPGISNLYLLPAGSVPPNPLELLQRPFFGALVRDLLAEFEHVVIDTPAAMRGADARAISAQSGAALVVARRNRTRMEPLEGLVAALARSSRVAGIVMNEH